MKIILATKSPYRRELMKYTGFDFIADSSEINEKFEGRPSEPKELVLCLSKLKAEAVAKKHENALVIGMDSLACSGKKIIEKPKNKSEMFERMKSYSGRNHEFYTGLTLINTKTKKIYQDVAFTRLRHRKLRDEEIKQYIEDNDGFETRVWGYDPASQQGLTFIDYIEGDPNNPIIGFPIAKLIEMINGALKDAERI